MENKTYKRFAHLWHMLDEGVWGKWIGGGWTAYGFAAFFRDEFLPPEVQEKARAVEMIRTALSIPIEWWMTIFLAILFYWLFEASFRSQRRTVERVQALEADLQPKFDLRFITHTSPKNVAPNEPAKKRWLELEVTNTSAVALRGVSAKLSKMTNAGGVGSHYETRPFAIKGHEEDDTSETDINPRDRACFRIAEETATKSNLGLTFPAECLWLHIENFPHTLTIAVTAENAEKQERTIVLSAPNRILTIEEVVPPLADQKQTTSSPRMFGLLRN